MRWLTIVDLPRILDASKKLVPAHPIYTEGWWSLRGDVPSINSCFQDFKKYINVVYFGDLDFEFSGITVDVQLARQAVAAIKFKEGLKLEVDLKSNRIGWRNR
jgi:hypothetical protein